MKQIDRRALARCIQEYSRDPRNAQRLKERAADGESWERRAMSACYSVQMNNMKLPPWGCPPVWSDGAAVEGSAFAVEQKKAKRLAARLRENKLSIFEPNPIAALHEVAESKRALHDVEPPPSAA